MVVAFVTTLGTLITYANSHFILVESLGSPSYPDGVSILFIELVNINQDQ
jgi:hypothetical protein